MRGHNDIHDDAEDKCTGDGGNCDLTEGKCHTADAGNENNSDDEEVFVFAEVNVLNHLETRYRNEAVKRHAHAAHYAGRNGCEEGHERSKE